MYEHNDRHMDRCTDQQKYRQAYQSSIYLPNKNAIRAPVSIPKCNASSFLYLKQLLHI